MEKYVIKFVREKYQIRKKSIDIPNFITKVKKVIRYDDSYIYIVFIFFILYYIIFFILYIFIKFIYSYN